MSTKPDTQIPDDILQAAIDAACAETAKEHSTTGGALAINPNAYPSSWICEQTARLALARGLLARLPEPTPPVSANGKTPGEVAFEAWVPHRETWEVSDYKDRWQFAAQAVLAAFGQGGLEQAIARMEAVPWKELDAAWDKNVVGVNGDTKTLQACFEDVRARLIAAASQDVQTADEPMTQAMSPKQISGTSWQPAVGDTVRLKSGAGFTMVIDAVNGPMASCEWHDATGQPQSRSYPAACLTPAKEAQP